MNNSGKVETAPGVGLYVHVPFCARPCEFCAFYQEKPNRNGIQQYLESIEMELERFPPVGDVRTVFMGGGTPSLLATQDLERLCQAIKKTAPSTTEWSIEMAPGTVKEEKLAMLKEMGVNRFSMGIQSFNPKTLEAIGRPHTATQVNQAIDVIRSLKIENWNLDLIFAASQQTQNDWLDDLRKAVDLGPKHISTYCLTFESDTKLFLKMLAGKKEKPTPQQEAVFYQATWDFLAKSGYQQYEISNFSKPGYACAHNVATWQMGEWFGYGPSAASQVGCDSGFLRYANVGDLESWRRGVCSGQRAWVDVEELTPQEIALDAIMFGMRMPAGIDLDRLEARFGRFLPNVREGLTELQGRLQDEGLLDVGQVWRLTQDGLLVADAVAQEIINLS